MRVAGRTLVRAGATAVALPTVLLLTAPLGAASQQDMRLAETAAETTPFGLLGPVGLVAVAVGLLGMLAGTVRHLKRVRARAEPPADAEQLDVRGPSQHATFDTAESHHSL